MFHTHQVMHRTPKLSLRLSLELRRSKNQLRKAKRTESPNWLRVQSSHREYEKVLYRAANQGKKRYEPTIAKRMAAKKKMRLAKKLGIAQTTQLQPEPVMLPIVQMILDDQTPITEQDHEALVQHHIAMYGNSAVLTKKFGPRTVVVIFSEPGKTAPKYRDVWQLEDGKQPRKLTASYGNKSPLDKLEASDWKWMVLKDFPDLIRHMIGAPPYTAAA